MHETAETAGVITLSPLGLVVITYLECAVSGSHTESPLGQVFDRRCSVTASP